MLTEQGNRRIYTVYYPGSFVPLLRVEGESSGWVYSLAEQLEQQLQTTFPAEVTTQFDTVEQELRKNRLSAETRQWLAQFSLSAESLQTLLMPLPASPQKVHIVPV